MNDVRRLLHDLVDDARVGAPPIAAMTSTRHRRVPVWWAPVAAAAAVAAVLAGVWALPKTAPERPSSPPAARTWQQLPTPPLSPRSQPISAYVDGKVVILGGSDRTFEGGPMNVPNLLDGAVLDPASRTWRRMPDAPPGLWNQAYTFAVSGDRLIIPLQNRRGWLMFDVGDNAWSRLPVPPMHLDQPSVAADADHLYATSSSDAVTGGPVLVLDLRTGEWSALPTSPLLDARLGMRELVMAGADLIVMGSLTPGVYPTSSRMTRAAAVIWNGQRWRGYASSDSRADVSGSQWVWTGDRIISGTRITQREARRERPDALPAGAFDPVTHAWTSLPWLPQRLSGAGGFRDYATNGSRLYASGYLYDDSTRRFVRVAGPGPWTDGAAALTDHSLVVMGGERPLPGQDGVMRVTEVELTNKAWILPLG